MINIKVATNKRGELLFKASVSNDLEGNVIVKRALFESKFVKREKKHPYIIPMRFFIPIVSNLGKDNIILDEESIIEFLEFSDFYEEQTYYIHKANAIYMRKWREEGCPKIFKIIINRESLTLEKFVAFDRLL